jgi:hypothetical protein
MWTFVIIVIVLLQRHTGHVVSIILQIRRRFHGLTIEVRFFPVGGGWLLDGPTWTRHTKDEGERDENKI